MGAPAKKSTGPILLVGQPETCPDIRYGAGFWAADPVVYLKAGDKSMLVVPDLEYGRAIRESTADRVVTPRHLRLKGPALRAPSEWAVAAVRAFGAGRVRVPASFPLGIARRLERAGVRVVCARADVMPERAVKSAEEIGKIRVVQQAAVIAMRAAVRMIGESSPDAEGRLVTKGEIVTSESVKRLIECVLLDHGCLGRNTIVAGGEQGADPHEQGHGPLRAHRPIVIDIFPQHMRSGYWGDLTRTVVRGAAGHELRRMYAAVRAAQAAALAKIRAGARCSAVHGAAANELAGRGFETGTRNGRPAGFIHGTGHGVGLAIHEAPSVSPSGGRLAAGHVITVEPGLYYPGMGGIRIEDTVEVTRDGWRYVVPCEKRFELFDGARQ